MKQLRHFIWDFDGTLFDTYPGTVRELRQLLREQGFDCDPREAMELMLENLGVALEHYCHRFGISPEPFSGEFLRRHRAGAQALEAPPMEGARQVLEAIRQRGSYSYIFTHRSAEQTRHYLEKHGLEGYFRRILGPESPGFARKPAPDGILRLMADYGMTPGDTVMIGDRDCDLGSARNAGIHTAHLVCPLVPQELSCSWRLEGLKDMLTLL